MIRKDVLVKRPEGTKIYRQRNCEYVYHVTGSEYKKDKQYVVEKRAEVVERHGEERHGRPLAGGQQHVEFALLRGWRHAARQVEEGVGGAGHG